MIIDGLNSVLSEGSEEYEYECCSSMRVNVTFLSRASDVKIISSLVGYCYHQVTGLLIIQSRQNRRAYYRHPLSTNPCPCLFEGMEASLETQFATRLHKRHLIRVSSNENVSMLVEILHPSNSYERRGTRLREIEQKPRHWLPCQICKLERETRIYPLFAIFPYLHHGHGVTQNLIQWRVGMWKILHRVKEIELLMFLLDTRNMENAIYLESF